MWKDALLTLGNAHQKDTSFYNTAGQSRLEACSVQKPRDHPCKNGYVALTLPNPSRWLRQALLRASAWNSPAQQKDNQQYAVSTHTHTLLIRHARHT